MSKKQKEKFIRTTLYLSERVWEALKRAAFEGDSSAQEIVNEEVEKYLLTRPVSISLTAYREGDLNEKREPRTIRFRETVWISLQAISKAERFSIAGLVDQLMIRRFDLETPVDYDSIEPAAIPDQDQEASQDVQEQNLDGQTTIGGERYLYDTRKVIDLNGESEENDPKGNNRKKGRPDP